MKAKQLRNDKRKYKRILHLYKEAIEDRSFRVSRRLHAILLNLEGYKAPQIADILKVHRTNVSNWLRNWETEGLQGVLEGYRPGRPCSITNYQIQKLEDILDSGPIAYGFNTGIWTSPMVARVIEDEFSVAYHPAHVSKILHELGFSVQRPRKILARADQEKQSRWVRYIYPNIKKKAQAQGAVLIYEDEASFRQDPTLYQTWARTGCQPLIPTTGQRKTLKYFGSVEVYSARFLYHRAPVFNALTYMDYLEQLMKRYFPQKMYLIQDNASYHKDSQVWDWFSANRKYIQVSNLPPYSPDFNAVERLWHHTRINATHNRYFTTVEDLEGSLVFAFRSMQKNPSQILGYLNPFQ